MRKITAKELIGFVILLMMYAFVSLLLFLTVSCSPKVVTVPEMHHEYHSHMDSVLVHDSVIDRQTVIIREADSALLAEYGITLRQAERAWIVQNNRLQREIQKLKETRGDTIEVHDTISVPYPVQVKEKKVSVKDNVLWCAQCIMISIFILFILKILFKRRNS